MSLPTEAQWAKIVAAVEELDAAKDEFHAARVNATIACERVKARGGPGARFFKTEEGQQVVALVQYEHIWERKIVEVKIELENIVRQAVKEAQP